MFELTGDTMPKQGAPLAGCVYDGCEYPKGPCLGKCSTRKQGDFDPKFYKGDQEKRETEPVKFKGVCPQCFKTICPNPHTHSVPPGTEINEGGYVGAYCDGCGCRWREHGNGRKEILQNGRPVKPQPRPGGTEKVGLLGDETNPEPDDINAVLAERGSRYGKFQDHAHITCTLKRTIAEFVEARGTRLDDDDQQEALDMIAHKIGRIINGDPNYADSWVDIAGYAKLVADRLQGIVR